MSKASKTSQWNWGMLSKLVMPGLAPRIHVLAAVTQERRGWPGPSSAKTRFALLPGHDEKANRFSSG
jgi:hypothetical protein